MVQICILIIIICMCFDFNCVFLIFPTITYFTMVSQTLWYHEIFWSYGESILTSQVGIYWPLSKMISILCFRGSHRGNWMWDDGERLPRGVCQVSDGTRDLRSHSDPSQPGTCSTQVLWVHMRFHSQVKKNC